MRGGNSGLVRLVGRRFAPLFVTNVLDAFNDNLFKTALLIDASYGVYRADPAAAERLAVIATGVFVLPFFVLSALAGQVADRLDRARLVRWVKLAEAVIMALGFFGFLAHSIEMLLVVLFLAGAHSAMYTPLKYAILPQHLGREELVTATGVMEAGGFVAILGGQLLAGVIAPWAAGATACTLALFGLAVSLAIPSAPAGSPGERIEPNLPLESWRLVRRAMGMGPVRYCLLASAWFYIVGAVVLGQLVPLARGVLHVQAPVTALFLGAFSFGVAAGALLAGRLLQGEVSGRLAPGAALALGGLLLDLAFSLSRFHAAGALMDAGTFLATPGAGRIVLDLFGAAAAGGLFVVPIYAVLQDRSPPAERSRILAANDIVNALTTVGAVAVAGLLLQLGLGSAGLFVVLGGSTLAVGLLAHLGRGALRAEGDTLGGTPGTAEPSR
jgi:acyl-[acyl-carrier-protein]-phospholipid O-acyltransferase / long-chain-fatty-acid--[acyl-carrier-protein] ligase